MLNPLTQKMIDTETLVLTKGQLFWHYCIVPFLLISPIVSTIDLLKYYLTDSYSGTRSIGEMATWSYLPVIPALAFYFIQKRKLKFKVIDISIDSESFLVAINQSAQQLNWQIIKKSQNLIVARSSFNWRSWGELITVIRLKDKILFNSICDPDNRASVASWGMNRVNFKSFEYHLMSNNHQSEQSFAP